MSKKPLVLIVDDDVSMRKACSRIAGSVGYKTETANNGQEALDCLAKYTPNMVLMDCDMPIMTGPEALSHIVELYPTLPVYMMTGMHSQDRENYLKSLGARACIAKPFKISFVVATLRQHLSE